MARRFKMVVPKPGACNDLGTDVKLYEYNELVEAKESWQEQLMDSFVDNNWAIEIKDDQASESGEAEQLESDNPERARNDKGHYIADDPSTPDVNEAYVGGKAPKKRSAKKSTKKKS